MRVGSRAIIPFALKELVKDERLRRSMGEKARESVQSRFLLTRLLEQYLDFSPPSRLISAWSGSHNSATDCCSDYAGYN